VSHKERPDEALIGYLIPEFPGQTHVWMWREIVHLRRWCLPIRIFSTRRPPTRDRARHAFAAAAEAETVYLWPQSPWKASAAVLWALLARPMGFARCIGLALTLPVTLSFRRLRLLTLIVPACMLARQCRRGGVAHLHSHSCSNSAILCMMVKRLLGIPFSMTLNANIEWWGGAMAEKFQEAEFTIAITQWLLDQMRREFPGLAPQQALLGRIGVDTDQWDPGEERVGHLDRTRIITVARLHPTKAQDVLLEAIAVLDRAGTKVSLQIVGDGPTRAELEAQVSRLGLTSSVAFLGSLGQEEIIDLMRGCDIFVLPSRFEPLGVAYMEAMSMGLATIGTTEGGVHEIIDDGVDGMLIPPGDPQVLAGAIGKLISDPTLRQEMGKAGRKKIIARFDSRIGAATVWERLMGRPAP
jgi:colanic acid/amylovoran biosynthesis glycosyltransferase